MTAIIKGNDIHIDNTWVVLVPASVDWLSSWIDEHYDGGLDADDNTWLGLYEGTGDYHALISLDNSGGDGSHQFISRITPFLSGKKIFRLVFEDKGVYEPVTVYVDGHIIENTITDPFKIAKDLLGTELPDTPKAEANFNSAVCIIEETSEEEVRRVIKAEFSSYPPFELITIPSKVIVYNKSFTVSRIAPSFASALQNKVVYGLFAGKNEKGLRFICTVYKGEQITGTYYYPNNLQERDEDEPMLLSVKEETAPEKIAAKLGVPSGLLNL
jgi:hypothetical protein